MLFIRTSVGQCGRTAHCLAYVMCVCVDGMDDTLEYGGHNVVGELEGLPETWLVVSKLWRSIGSVTAR